MALKKYLKAAIGTIHIQYLTWTHINFYTPLFLSDNCFHFFHFSCQSIFVQEFKLSTPTHCVIK